MIRFLSWILKVVGTLLGIVVLALLALIGALTATEYKPEDKEVLSVEGEADAQLSVGDSFSIVSWNIGYGGLGEDADFFMDGGKSVQSASEDQVRENITGINAELTALNPDVVFLQEVDSHSKRSYYIDEKDEIGASLSGFQSAFAYNYKTLFVPYPIPPIGQVNAGLATFSKYGMNEAVRVALPCPFDYPIRLANLKRCLLVSRIPIEGTDAELVLINLHLEAYDDGEGKAAQTAQLKALMQEEIEAGNYVIAGGDFNQTFSNVDTDVTPVVSEDLWQPGIIDVSEFEGSELYTDALVPSCRSLDVVLSETEADQVQYYIIDGFFVSKNLVVTSVETQDLKFQYSDHNPVCLKLKIQ